LIAVFISKIFRNNCKALNEKKSSEDIYSPKAISSQKFISEFQLSSDFQTFKMWKKILVNVLLLVSAISAADNAPASASASNAKIVCYYDSRAFGKEGKNCAG
jgi:hypothetical protein